MLELHSYEITQRLDQNNYTSHYRAINSETHHSVIIKTHTAQLASEIVKQHLRHEHHIGSRLQSSYVVDYLHLIETPERIAIILADDNAEGLFGYITAKTCALEGYLDIAIQLAAGLNVIHQEHIVHQAIQPHHIIIQPDTQQVKYINFSRASTYTDSSQELNQHAFSPERLPYLSPELTGRMNRQVDYRTDFYALGVTLYELLTRRVPFTATDPMEVIHAHLSKEPIPPHKINPTIPTTLSAIVLKLLAKNPDDRYQSSLGLQADLELCLQHYRQGKATLSMTLGTRDHPEQFRLSEKLYGREREVSTLLKTLEATDPNHTELLLVSGYSGVGKTALIRAIQSPLMVRRGYFVTGKFEQLSKAIAYSAIVQAFRQLMKQLLGEPDSQIKFWKQTLLHVLGSNGQIIIRMIPELELIIGPQPPVPSLGPKETQDRFDYVFQSFVHVFAQSSHPLVLFLDDLQWADVGSLRLLKLMSTDYRQNCLLLIGAYRDNEVSPTHRTMILIDTLKQADVPIHHLHLSVLTQPAVTHWLMDTLHATQDVVTPLAELVFRRTQGNPFFVRVFLQSLHDDQLLTRNINGQWQWNMPAIQQQKATDNVADFMIERIKRLPPSTKDTLKIAACLGDQFILRLLGIVSNQSNNSIMTSLKPALAAGLVVPTRSTYQFVHDRVKEAAYALISPTDKAATHLHIGRSLLQHLSETERTHALLNIVDHLNKGHSLIDSPTEQLSLAELNLHAGQQAKMSTAYTTALHYFKMANSLLPQDAWQQHYALAFNIHRDCADAYFLCSDYENADKYCQIALTQAKTALEKANILRMQLIYFNMMEKLDESIEAGLKALKLLGFKIAKYPSYFSILLQYLRIKFYLRNKRIAEFIHNPTITDPRQILTLQIMTDLAVPNYMIGNKKLLILMLLKQVNVVMRHGDSPVAAFTYIAFGGIFGAVFGDLHRGYEFGQLALALIKKTNNINSFPKVYYVYGTHITAWNHHWGKIASYYQQVIQYGMKTGDLFYLSTAHSNLYIWDPEIQLSSRLEYLQKQLPFLLVIDYLGAIIIAKLQVQWILCLQQSAHDNLTFSSTFYSEKQIMIELKQRKTITSLAYFYYYKLQIHFIFEEYQTAVDYFEKTNKLSGAYISTAIVAEVCLYGFLILSKLYPEKHGKERYLTWYRMRKTYHRMRRWANHCPENFLHLCYLMKAELARHAQHNRRAEDYYDQAIEGAKTNRYPRFAAIANEYAAHYYLMKQRDKLAAIHLQDALNFYQWWGAHAKVKHMQRRYAHVFKHLLLTTPAEAVPSQSELFINCLSDVQFITQASQAISTEIDIERLVIRLMEIILTQTGAEKGYLLLATGKDLELVVRASIHEQPRVQRIHRTLSEATELLSNMIIHYVQRTQDSVVLADANSDERFQKDTYLQHHHPQSLLCHPIVRQDRFIGIIYLENNQAQCAFTSERIEVLSILSAQAAISLENAQLYAAQRKAEKQIKQHQHELAHVSRLVTMGELASGLAHELNQPLTAAASYIDGCIERLQQQPSTQLITRSMQLALNNVKRAGQVIHNLKEFLCKGILERQLVSMNEAIKEVLTLIEYKIVDTTIDVDLQLDTTLPSIKVDKIQIQQVIVNLLHNALDALQTSAIEKPKIVIKTEQPQASTIQLSIIDNGPGIPTEIMNQVFDPFLTTKDTGMGLGLTIARSIIETHAGKLYVDNSNDQGTTFCLILPILGRD